MLPLHTARHRNHMVTQIGAGSIGVGTGASETAHTARMEHNHMESETGARRTETPQHHAIFICAILYETVDRRALIWKASASRIGRCSRILCGIVVLCIVAQNSIRCNSICVRTLQSSPIASVY
jgi:hypothetical protein